MHNQYLTVIYDLQFMLTAAKKIKLDNYVQSSFKQPLQYQVSVLGVSVMLKHVR